MNSPGNRRSSVSSSKEDEDFLIKQILLTHDPDGRFVDSESLLRLTQNIMFYAKLSQASDGHSGSDERSDIWNIEVFGSEEPLGHTIYEISRQVLCYCYAGRNNKHAKTMSLFDRLGYYKWDTKALLVLLAFVISYSEFRLLMQLYSSNSLAASMALLKQLPSDMVLLRPRFKYLSILLNIMIGMIEWIIKFEGLPVRQVFMENEIITQAKSQVYVGTYWIIRSALSCFSQITDLTTMKNEQVFFFFSFRNSNSAVIASWELVSLLCRLSNLSGHLRQQVNATHQLIETKMHEKLLKLFKEAQLDNQETLGILLASKDSFPLKDCSSQAKVELSELKNKVVILLVSKPDLFPLETLFLLVQQLLDHPHQAKLKGSYEIVWVPIPSSDAWTLSEEQSFEFFSNSLPWNSIRQPWSLSSIVVNFIKHVWSFKEEPLMVVFDTQGTVTNLNAMDMTLIWGARAHPFSISREHELWEEETWSLNLLLNRIDPLVSNWVEEEQNLCIYGGGSLNWIRRFNAKMRGMTSSGLQLKMIYVGKKNLCEQTRCILSTIKEQNREVALTLTKINFFWLRLESMRRSKLRLGCEEEKDRILKQLFWLLETEESDQGWVLIGTGSSEVIKLQGKEVDKFLDASTVWGANVGSLGLVDAIRAATEPTLLADKPCGHSTIVPFLEGMKKTMVCEKCRRPMKQFLVYQ
ncbi:hypothetical protein NMG60_11024828 [Bertholletia excelsa]